MQDAGSRLMARCRTSCIRRRVASGGSADAASGASATVQLPGRPRPSLKPTGLDADALATASARPVLCAPNQRPLGRHERLQDSKDCSPFVRLLSFSQTQAQPREVMSVSSKAEESLFAAPVGRSDCARDRAVHHSPARTAGAAIHAARVGSFPAGIAAVVYSIYGLATGMMTI